LKREQQLSRLGGRIDLVDSGDGKDSLVPVINPHDFRRIVTLTTLFGRVCATTLPTQRSANAKAAQYCLRGPTDFTQMV
jgi:hypothetical protein